MVSGLCRDKEMTCSCLDREGSCSQKGMVWLALKMEIWLGVWEFSLSLHLRVWLASKAFPYDSSLPSLSLR